MSFARGHDIVSQIARHLARAPALERCSVSESLRGTSRKQNLPLVTVLALRESADEPVNRKTGVARVITRIGVLVAVAVINDPGGAKAKAKPGGDPCRTPAPALAGWCPDGARDPLAWREGHLVDQTASYALWQDSFDATWWAKEERGDGR